MAAVNSPTISPNLSPNTFPYLELKPVFGEGREQHWESVQKILRGKIAPLFGSQEELIKTLNSGDFKCRLLLEDTKPTGLLVYKTKLSEFYEWKDCLEITLLYADDQEESKNSQPLSTFLLQEASHYAKKKWKAASICLSISKKAEQMVGFFKQNQFEVIKDQELQTLLGKKLTVASHSPEKVLVKETEIPSEKREDVLHKRKREDVFEPNKKAKTLETQTYQGNPSYPPPYQQPLQRTFSERNLFSRTQTHSSTQQQTAIKTDECPIQKKYFTMIKAGKKQ